MINIYVKEKKIQKQVKRPLIPNPKERKRVALSIIALLISSIIILYLQATGGARQQHMDYSTYSSLRNYAGIAAAYGFGFCMLMFTLRRIMRLVKSQTIKEKLGTAVRFVRQWHVPVSIVAFSIVMIHVYLVLSRGFYFDAEYVSGLAALLVLAVQMLSGIFRFRGKGVKFHMILGIAFFILMLIHVFSGNIFN